MKNLLVREASLEYFQGDETKMEQVAAGVSENAQTARAKWANQEAGRSAHEAAGAEGESEQTLDQMMEDVKLFIRSIDINAL